MIESREVFGWGTNKCGQLGLGIGEEIKGEYGSSEPQQITFFNEQHKSVVSISCDMSNHSGALIGFIVKYAYQ